MGGKAAQRGKARRKERDRAQGGKVGRKRGRPAQGGKRLHPIRRYVLLWSKAAFLMSFHTGRHFFFVPIPHAAFPSPPPDSIGPRGSNPSLWVLARRLKPFRPLHPPSVEAQLPLLVCGPLKPWRLLHNPAQNGRGGTRPSRTHRHDLIPALGGTTSASSGFVLQEIPWFSLFSAARPR